ncbi:MAG: hypothetical protein ACFCUN_12280 [Hyphomicrobiaceae bacterium]
MRYDDRTEPRIDAAPDELERVLARAADPRLAAGVRQAAMDRIMAATHVARGRSRDVEVRRDADRPAAVVLPFRSPRQQPNSRRGRSFDAAAMAAGLAATLILGILVGQHPLFADAIYGALSADLVADAGTALGFAGDFLLGDGDELL